MKKVLKVMTVFAMALAFVGCGSDNKDEGTTEGNAEAKTIYIGISPDYPPYDALDANGDLEGFDIDMTNELFRIMNENGANYTPEFTQMSFDTIVSSVGTGQIDLGISGFTYDEDRQVSWSVPYNESRQVALVPSDSDIAGKEDLAGKLIGAQAGATAENVANEIKDSDDSTQVTTMKDVKVLVETLKTGGIDVLIADYAVVKNYADNNEDLKMIDESLLDEENFIITKLDDNKELLEQINKAIETFKASDKYQELKTKWGV